MYTKAAAAIKKAGRVVAFTGVGFAGSLRRKADGGLKY